MKYELKIREQIDHFNNSVFFELVEIESSEALHEADTKQECIEYFETLDKNKYQLASL